MMMEAVYTYETLVYFYKTTWSNIPEECQLHGLGNSFKHMLDNKLDNPNATMGGCGGKDEHSNTPIMNSTQSFSLHSPTS
jgi:hypothetical protein